MAEPLPPAESLQVLMIALGDEVLTGWGDTHERHLEYAARIGHLHMIVYSPRSRNLHPTALSDRLTVYPTRSLTRPGFLLGAYRLGVRLCRRARIDVITTQDPFATGLVGLWLKRRFHIPLDLQNHSDFFDNPYWIAEKPLRYGLFNRLGKWVIRHGDTHRVLNQIEKEKYVRMGIDPARVAVLATPVRLQRFEPEGRIGEGYQLRLQLGLAADMPLLMWAGRPGPVKQVTLLVEAFARVRRTHPRAHLVLVGDFSRDPSVPERVRALGLSDSVHFTGQLPHEALAACYRASTIYVHSSLYEGLGKVLIEAAACELPVVSTRTAGAQEVVIDGQTGLLCELDDPDGMADRIRLLLDQPGRAAVMGGAARRHVLQKFDHTRNLEAVVETWQRAAALKGGR